MLNPKDKKRRTSNEGQMRKMENKYQDCKFKPSHIYDCIKCRVFSLYNVIKNRLSDQLKK